MNNDEGFFDPASNVGIGLSFYIFDSILTLIQDMIYNNYVN